MDSYTKYIILNHLYWIKAGLTKKDIIKIHSEVSDDDVFQNVTISKIQTKKGYVIEGQEIIEEPDFLKITYLFLNYSEHVLDLSFLKYCINLEEVTVRNQKLKDLNAFESLENIKKIDASGNEIENIDALYSFKNLEELNLQRNAIKSLQPIIHLKQLKKIEIDELNDETEIFQILKNNSNCSVSYILKGDDIDFDNFRFPFYLVVITKTENNISLFLEATSNKLRAGSTIKFPKELLDQPNFRDKYIAKIKKEATERLEKITGAIIKLNEKQMLYFNEFYSFEYKHEIGIERSLL